MDSSESLHFSFDCGAAGAVRYTVTSSGDLNHNGEVGEGVITGYDFAGAPLGTALVHDLGACDVSQLFSHRPLAAFSITANVDNQMIASVSYVPEAVIEFSQARYPVEEDGTCHGPGVSVVRKGDTNAPASVAITATGGTAASGADYAATFPMVVNLQAGQTHQDIALGVVLDELKESTEQLILELTSVTGAVYGTCTSATVVIVGDEPRQILTVAPHPITGSPALQMLVTNPIVFEIWSRTNLAGGMGWTREADTTVTSQEFEVHWFTNLFEPAVPAKFFRAVLKQ